MRQGQNVLIFPYEATLSQRNRLIGATFIKFRHSAGAERKYVEEYSRWDFNRVVYDENYV